MLENFPKIDVLISTCNERVVRALDVLLPFDARVRYILVHQIFGTTVSEKSFQIVSDVLKKRTDVKYIRTESKGLSVSRNIALSNSSAEFILFADDDIHYLPNAIDKVLNAFEELPNADVLTFRFTNGEGGHGKSYPSSLMRRTYRNLFSVSSVEVAIRRNAYLGCDAHFDERFGLGAKFPVSEENIFLSDLYSAGKKIYFYPEDILTHPDETSGGNWGVEHLKARGALFKRVFSWYGFPLLLLFLFKHSNKIGAQGGRCLGFKIAVTSFYCFKK